MQRSEWTFYTAIEVTCNIFSLHAFCDLMNRPLEEIKWLDWKSRKLTGYLNKPPTYEDWKQNAQYALYLFVLLIKAFGWQAMYRFMREYEEDIAKNVTCLPKSDADKIDQWVVRFSRIVGKNLKAHFEKFGLPVTDAVDFLVGDLEPWFSNEF